MLKLNPYAAVTKRKAILATKKRLLEKVLLDAKKSGVSSNIEYFKSVYFMMKLLESTGL